MTECIAWRHSNVNSRKPFYKINEDQEHQYVSAHKPSENKTLSRAQAMVNFKLIEIDKLNGSRNWARQKKRRTHLLHNDNSVLQTMTNMLVWCTHRQNKKNQIRSVHQKRDVSNCHSVVLIKTGNIKIVVSSHCHVTYLSTLVHWINCGFAAFCLSPLLVFGFFRLFVNRWLGLAMLGCA